MKLTEETKQKIRDILDSEEFKKTQYSNLPEEKRIALGQFYTPASICIKLIEKFETETLSGKTILDPTCGSGNLLIACLAAGADPDKIFGNEYDETAVKLCRERINRTCEILNKQKINDWQIHQGNALIKDCLVMFGPEYDETILKELLKRRNGMSGGWLANPEHYNEITLFDDFLN